MSEDAIIPIVICSLLFGIPLVAVVGHYSYLAWKAWLELNLKREMVARGYTAEEIVHVLQAKTSGNCPAQAPPPWAPAQERPRSATY